MKIGINIGVAPPGAFHNLVKDLSDGISSISSHEVHIFYINDNLHRNFSFSKNVFLYRMTISRTRHIPIYLIKKIKELNLDVIISMYTENNLMTLISKPFNRKVKYIISEHSTLSYKCNIEYNKKGRHRFLQFFVRLLYKWADGFYAVSEDVLSDLKNNVKVNFKNCQTIHIDNPISKKRLNKKITEKNKYQIAKKKFNIISVGRLEKQKNYLLLLKSIKMLKNENIVVHIIGEGDQRKHLEQYINQNNLNNIIKLSGYNNNPWNVMSKCDLFVLPSEEEPFGLVLVEAMICGLPIISTKPIGGGPQNILKNGKIGILLNNNTPEEMAKEIKKLLLSEKLRKQYINLGIKRAKDFSPEVIAQKLLNFIEQLK